MEDRALRGRNPSAVRALQTAECRVGPRTHPATQLREQAQCEKSIIYRDNRLIIYRGHSHSVVICRNSL